MAKQGEPLTAKTAERQSIPLENIVVSEIPLQSGIHRPSGSKKTGV